VTRLRLAVVAAGLSQPSATRLLADQLAVATRRSLESSGAQLQTDVIELRDHAHDLVNNLLSGFPSGELAAVIDTVRRADGLVVVTPIFNASYSGLLKVFSDVLDPDSLAGKPVLVGATGGTARHSLALEHALRPLFVYLRAVVVPTAVFAASEDWGSGDSGRESSLAARIDRAAGELARLMRSGASAPAPDHHAPAPDRYAPAPDPYKPAPDPYKPEADPYDNPVPFETLLAAQKPHA
jgi:FMN reductase